MIKDKLLKYKLKQNILKILNECLTVRVVDFKLYEGKINNGYIQMVLFRDNDKSFHSNLLNNSELNKLVKEYHTIKK